MRLARRSAVAMLMAGVFLAGCGDDDDNEPSGNTLSTAETQALSAALSQSGMVEGSEALLFPLVVGGAVEYGSFTVPEAVRAAARERLKSVLMNAAVGGVYDGTAFQAFIDFTVDGEQVRFCESGLLAWQGLDADAQTVDELILVGGVEDNVAGCSDAISGEISQDDAFAALYDGVNDITYYGISGFATLDDASFSGGADDCSTTVPGFGTITCSYQYGDMAGSFQFEGQNIAEVPQSISFPETGYDLPAVKVSLSGSFTTGTLNAGSLRILPLRKR